MRDSFHRKTTNAGLLDLDEPAIEHLFQKFADVLLDDLSGSVVGLGERHDDGLELRGVGEQSPNVRARFPQAEALARLEGHQDNFGADRSFGRAATAADRNGIGDANFGHSWLGSSVRCRRCGEAQALRFWGQRPDGVSVEMAGLGGRCQVSRASGWAGL